MFTVEVTPQSAEAKRILGFDVESLSQEQLDALKAKLGLGEQGSSGGSSDGIYTPVITGEDEDAKSVADVARDYYWDSKDMVNYLNTHGIEGFDASEYGWVRALSKVIEHLNRRIIALESQAGIPTSNPYDREYR